MKKTRIVIADDHTILRGGVRLLLEQIPDVEVVGEAADATEAIELVQREAPDVLPLDIAMPGMNGLEAAEDISLNSPSTHIIILSMHSDPEYVHRAVKAGAEGYVIKRSAIEELELAIRSVVRGELFLSPSIAGPFVVGFLDGPAAHGRHPELTSRQIEVLKLIADGGTTKAIARKLGISVKTVESHRAEVMNRLKIYDVAGLVRYAIRNGLTSAEL